LTGDGTVSAVANDLGVVMRKLNSWWKIAIACVACVLWMVGLIDQLDSPQMTAGYLALSAAIVAVAIA
jgi:hypothetical protein